MASKARADAARRNGAKSKGPVTAEGKARSSKNAITNGLYTDLILLPGENHELFAYLHQVLTDIHKPRNEEECMLVRDLVHNRWRIERMRQLQAAAIDDEMTQQRPIIDSQYKWMDGATRGARAIQKLCDESGTVEMYERVETRLQNAILRLGKYIRDLQDRTPGAGQPGAGAAGPGDSQASPAANAQQATTASGPLNLAQNLSRNFFLPQEEATPRHQPRRSRAPKPAILSPETENPAIGNEPSEPPKYFVAGAASAYSPEPVPSPENEHPAIGNEPKYFVAGAASAYPPTKREPSELATTATEPLKYFVAGAVSADLPEPEIEHPPTKPDPTELATTASYGAATVRERCFANMRPRPSNSEQFATASHGLHSGVP